MRQLGWVELGLVDRLAEANGLPFAWKAQPEPLVPEASPSSWMTALLILFAIHPSSRCPSSVWGGAEDLGHSP